MDGPIIKDAAYYSFWSLLALLYILTKLVDWYLLWKK
jgi:hypothetical protein